MKETTKNFSTEPKHKKYRWGRPAKTSGENALKTGPKLKKVNVDQLINPNVPTTKTEVLDINLIGIKANRREIDANAVKALVASVAEIGIQNPISVQLQADGKYVLVAGRHRLEAAKRLGFLNIPARVLDASTAELWSPSENLHRSNLNALDKCEAISDFAAAFSKRRDGRRAHPLRGGKQPFDRGNSGVGKELNMDRKQVRQAKRIASISESVKAQIRASDLQDKLKILDKIANLDSPATQLKFIYSLAKDGSRVPGRLGEMGDLPHQAHEDCTLSRLVQQWKRMKLSRDFAKASPKVRERFVAEVWRYPMQSTADWG